MESFEAANSESLKAQAAKTMRTQVIALNLKAELEASMADVLEVRGIGFEDADDDLLAHEMGHYITKLQEKFMPHGLHVFGQDWSAESLKLMADSMNQVAGGFDATIAEKLAISPRLEMEGLLAGLAGRFVAPGKGNDPLRSPEALPTGRNLGSFDAFLWKHVDHRTLVNPWKESRQIPASTPLSDAVSKDLKKAGFSFVGTTIVYAYMQAIGMVDDHLDSCFRKARG